MTRHRIPTILGAILVILIVGFQSPAVRAYEPCDGHAENRCAVTTTTTTAITGMAILNADGNLLRLQRACTLPPVGLPTCYTPQADGTWMREEMNIDASGSV